MLETTIFSHGPEDAAVEPVVDTAATGAAGAAGVAAGIMPGMPGMPRPGKPGNPMPVGEQEDHRPLD